MKIVVIGGTGLIGSRVVTRLRGKGHEAVAAAPKTGVNTITGEGLVEVLKGAEVVVDVANSPTLDDSAVEFFETAGKNLAAAEAKAEVRHHIALSIVGADLLQDSGYFRGKLAQERAVENAPIPYTLIRATQFFEFLRGIAQWGTRNGVVRLPHAMFQPVAAEDVAIAVAEAAIAKPMNRMIELAGPDIFFIDELVADVLKHDSDPRMVIVDPEKRYFGVRLGEKALIPGSEARIGSISFQSWIASVPPSR